MTRIIHAFIALLVMIAALPAQAGVVITFWSHELGNSFPHAFFTLRGIPDAGGAAVDTNFGFTPKAITPAILFGPVKGRIDIAKPGYISGSDAQFSLELTDTQFADILLLVKQWSEATGDATYRMNERNCVHFAREAARRAGLSSIDFPALMKKPRSYLQAVAATNPQVTIINRHGREYIATLPALADPRPVVATVAAIPVN